jgi:hypothetical protein
MKIRSKSLLVATGLAFVGWVGGAVAQSADQSATQPVPPTAAAPDAVGNPTAIPEQTQVPASGAAVVASTMTNGPVPDTPANRARYGGPMSHAGKRTAPTGN